MKYSLSAKLKTPRELYGVPEHFDFAEHNIRQKEAWDAFYAGKPSRPPVTIGTNERFIMLNSALNPQGITFADYVNDPYVMFQIGLQTQWYIRHYLIADHEMGLPTFWKVGSNFMNTSEAQWFGASIHATGCDVPDLRPILTDDNKYALIEKGVPDPFTGFGAKVLDFYEFYKEMARQGYEYDGIPVTQLYTPMGGTDGPMTIACDLRGATEFCIDFYEDPDYAKTLLNFITDATILRIKAYRKLNGIPEVMQSFFLADDSIALISPEIYREFVLPCHKKLVTALSDGTKPNGIHLCGDASRHFVTLRDELDINSFDTGYPIDHRKIMQALGPDVTLSGGPKAELFRIGNPESIRAETLRIFNDVKDVSRRLILREANNLPPCTPLQNVTAFYDTVVNCCRYE